MARTAEQIQADIDEAEIELANLSKLPTRFTVHGQTVDNTNRIRDLRARLRDLHSERSGRSSYQGPDLIV